MLDRLTANLDFSARALELRAERQKVLANNIANADTPGYQARDFDFRAALGTAVGGTPQASTGVAATDSRHLAPLTDAQTGFTEATTLKYRKPDQPSLDGNTVDLDRERANFADNALRYEASLRFINGNVRQILSAIRGDVA